jgi:hypothetical protein
LKILPVKPADEAAFDECTFAAIHLIWSFALPSPQRGGLYSRHVLIFTPSVDACSMRFCTKSRMHQNMYSSMAKHSEGKSNPADCHPSLRSG